MRRGGKFGRGHRFDPGAFSTPEVSNADDFWRERRMVELEEQVASMKMVIDRLLRNGLQQMLIRPGVIGITQTAPSNTNTNSNYGLLYYGSGKYGGE